jgi:hypothetical protein
MKSVLGWLKFTPLFLTLCFASAEEVDWVQLHAVISYKRVGTSATASEGSFTFTFDAKLDQVMARAKPNEGDKLPAYYLLSEYEPSFRLSGTAHLDAEVTQVDGDKTYTASASLGNALGKAEDLQLKEVKPANIFGPGFTAMFSIGAHLKGSVKSNYPRMPRVAEEDSVLLWPTPVKFGAEEGFITEGEYTVFPVLGPRPKDEQMGILYDMVAATDSLPGLGGFRPPAIGAVVKGGAKDWVMTFHTEKKFETGSGGSYTDTISVEIQPVPLTLPLPKEAN